jgi:hypothetical protein
MELYIRTVGRIQDTLYAALKNLVCSLLYIQKTLPPAVMQAGEASLQDCFESLCAETNLLRAGRFDTSGAGGSCLELTPRHFHRRFERILRGFHKRRVVFLIDV